MLVFLPGAGGDPPLCRASPRRAGARCTCAAVRRSVPRPRMRALGRRRRAAQGGAGHQHRRDQPDHRRRPHRHRRRPGAAPRFDPAHGMKRLETVRSRAPRPTSAAAAPAARRRASATGCGPRRSTRRWWPQTPPEILEADLAPLALELAAGAASDPVGARWLDPPPRPRSPRRASCCSVSRRSTPRAGHPAGPAHGGAGHASAARAHDRARVAAGSRCPGLRPGRPAERRDPLRAPPRAGSRPAPASMSCAAVVRRPAWRSTSARCSGCVEALRGASSGARAGSAGASVADDAAVGLLLAFA